MVQAVSWSALEGLLCWWAVKLVICLTRHRGGLKLLEGAQVLAAESAEEELAAAAGAAAAVSLVPLNLTLNHKS